MIELDQWQRRILETKGNICLVSGRQIGKSLIVSIKAGDYALQNPNKSVLIISATERQAEELFTKVLYYVQDMDKSAIRKGKDKPTKHKLVLKNGSIIRCLPTGLAGIGIRGFTIDLLIADECAYINEEVFSAVTPMLLTTGGDMILLSTPRGREGYLYKRYNDPNFTTFHLSTEQVIKDRPISPSWTLQQREYALKHLEEEKARMSSLEYEQEYRGQFISDLKTFFSEELIKRCMKNRNKAIREGNTYFLGVDVSRLGKDLTSFEIIDRTHRNRLIHVENITTSRKYLTDTAKTIIELNKRYNFKKIYIDDGGVGGGVFDYLLEVPEVKRKIVAINNKSRPLDKDDKYKKKMLKHDLYNNMLGLMERGELELLDDDEVYLSLKSTQYEYIKSPKGEVNLRIFSENNHITEGLVRACWCSKDKTLNIWAR